MSAFQITPFGLVIIGVYSFVICVIAFVLSRAIASIRWRWWAIGPPVLVLMALPWGEEAWIAWHFKEACKSAGATVNRQVEVDGFYDSTMQSGYSLIRDKGYRFMEHPSDQRKRIDHIEMEHGQWKRTTIDQPKARYHFKYSYQPKPFHYEASIGWKIEKLQYEVVDNETGEILGLDARIIRYPNFSESLWLRFFGPGNAGCSGPLDASIEQSRAGPVYEKVLIPKKSP